MVEYVSVIFRIIEDKINVSSVSVYYVAVRTIVLSRHGITSMFILTTLLTHAKGRIIHNSYFGSLTCSQM